MNWSKRKYLFIIIGVGVITGIDLLTRFWFWKELNLIFDASNFNNVVTPIAAILSVLLFSYLAIKQYRLQLSSNLKLNFDREFEDLYERMNDDIGQRVLMAVGVRFDREVKYSVVGMNSLNYLDELIKAFERIFADADFINDHREYLDDNTVKLHKNYLQKRTYYNDLEFVMGFVKYPTAKYLEVETFLDQVNASELIESDKKYFRAKTESRCLERYFSFVIHRGGAVIPDLSKEGVEVSWKAYRAAGFDKHLLPFRGKLKS